MILFSTVKKTVDGIVLTFRLLWHYTVVKEPCGSGKLVSLRKDWILIAVPRGESTLLKRGNRTDDNDRTSRTTLGLVILEKKKKLLNKWTHQTAGMQSSPKAWSGIYERVGGFQARKLELSALCNVTESCGGG